MWRPEKSKDLLSPLVVFGSFESMFGTPFGQPVAGAINIGDDGQGRTIGEDGRAYCGAACTYFDGPNRRCTVKGERGFGGHCRCDGKCGGGPWNGVSLAVDIGPHTLFL